MERVHNRDKYPEIWAAFEKAKADKASLVAKRKVHRDKMNKLYEKIEKHNAPIKKEIEELAVKANENRVELLARGKEVSRLAKAMGGHTLTAPLG